jgi:thiamine phosphate synthase YjbQ (UPF0047 family)
MYTVHFNTYSDVYSPLQYIQRCVQSTAIHTAMCTVYCNTYSDVYSLLQYIQRCVQSTAIHTAMCTVYCIHTAMCSLLQYIPEFIVGLRYTGRSCLFFFVGAFAKLRKATINFMSVRLSAWNNSAPTKPIFMKIYISLSFENLSRKFKFR